jgi:hypothetical protein
VIDDAVSDVVFQLRRFAVLEPAGQSGLPRVLDLAYNLSMFCAKEFPAEVGGKGWRAVRKICGAGRGSAREKA